MDPSSDDNRVMSNEQETISLEAAQTIWAWMDEGFFTDIDAAWDAYQEWGTLGFLFGEGAKNESHTAPEDGSTGGPEFPGAMRAWDDRPEWMR